MYHVIVLWYSQFKLHSFFVLLMLFRSFLWGFDHRFSFIDFLLDHLLYLTSLTINFIQQKRIVFITKLHNVLLLNNLIMISWYTVLFHFIYVYLFFDDVTAFINNHSLLCKSISSSSSSSSNSSSSSSSSSRSDRRSSSRSSINVNYDFN